MPYPTMMSGWLTYQQALQHWGTDLFGGAPGALGLIGLGIVVLSVLIGLWRGFSAEVLGLAAWAAAFVLTGMYYGRIEPWLETGIHNRMIANVLALVGSFFVVLLAGRLVARFISRLVLLSPLGGIDRLLGGCFGALRGLMIVMLLYAAATWVLPAPGPALGSAALGKVAQGGVTQIITSQISHFMPQLPKFVPSSLALPDGSRHDLAERNPSEASGHGHP